MLSPINLRVHRVKIEPAVWWPAWLTIMSTDLEGPQPGESQYAYKQMMLFP